jgi:LuxR family transcriptional regulator, maltose regulon positive regulatory protein
MSRRSRSSRASSPGAALVALRPPGRRRSVVARERLLGRIDDLDGVKLVTVVAPAGYGKSTLLLEWLHRLEARGRRTAWQTLDDQADDPERAAALVHAALASLEEGDEPAVLFLDGFEAVGDAETQAALRDRVSRLSAGRAIVIGSRAAPELGLARLRVRGELREIRADELRFDVGETAALVRGEHGLALDEDVVAELHRHTEGWVAAIRLTALALEGRRDAAAFVRRLSGERATIAEYLAESVLARQPEDVRAFLLETSILDRLSGPLCDAVTGSVGGYAMLDRLERAQLFLQPLDETRRWFRHHALFAEFLRGQLTRDDPERVSTLHRRAAGWLVENDAPLDAIGHAFAAGDLELAARLLDEHAIEAVRAGRNSQVVRWTERLGPAWLARHPRVGVAAAWAHVFLREVPEARAALEAIPPAARRLLDPRERDEILTIEAAVELCEDRVLEAGEVARANLARLSGDGTFAHGAISNIVGFGLLAASRFEEARTRFVEARASFARAGSRFGEGYSIVLLGLVEATQGRLRSAIEVYRAADRLDEGADGARYASAVVAAHAADALYERGELVEAEERLRDGLDLGDDFSWLGATGSAPLALARLRFAAGDVDEALRFLDSAEHEAVRRRFARAVAAVRWERVRFALRRGDVALARELVRAIETSAEPEGVFHPLTETEARDLGWLRLRLRTGDARRAIAEIETRAAEADRLRRGWRALKLAVLRVEALEVLGEHAGALRALRQALRRGAGEGFVRSFADEGEPLASLLAELRRGLDGEDDEIPAAYLDRVLGGGRSAAAGLPRELAEPLSERELEVLSLAAHGLSNERLARRLFISENTVKTHLKNVFAKLGVRNRTAALFAARSRKLIP